jgi:hypothetical protein
MTFTAPDIPETVGRQADLYAEVRTLRLAMAKEVEEVQRFEADLRGRIIASLAEEKSLGRDSGAAGLKYRAQLVQKEKPRVTDWAAFTGWVRTHDRFDMLEKRIAAKALMDYVEAEAKDVPGTERIILPDVSITKI